MKNGLNECFPFIQFASLHEDQTPAEILDCELVGAKGEETINA